MQSKKNGPAIERFSEKKAQAKELLKKLQSDIAKWGKTGEVNWGDVGSMSHVIELLTEADEFINGTSK